MTRAEHRAEKLALDAEADRRAEREEHRCPACGEHAYDRVERRCHGCEAVPCSDCGVVGCRVGQENAAEIEAAGLAAAEALDRRNRLVLAGWQFVDEDEPAARASWQSLSPLAPALLHVHIRRFVHMEDAQRWQAGVDVARPSRGSMSIYTHGRTAADATLRLSDHLDRIRWDDTPGLDELRQVVLSLREGLES